ncbi:TolC family protein [Clostridium peptidivorans]|uniref:TolC family protein n=1 Tax=Clostridium peptidivorans TaxID=100174 RepID=UPI0015C6F19A|nr:TolC family protein [Clostridium peptidivorans]
MKKRSFLIGMLCALIISAIVISPILNIKASNTEDNTVLNLTKEKAVEMALSNVDNFQKLNTLSKNMDIQLDMALDLKEKMQETLDAIQDYKNLYSRIQKIEGNPAYDLRQQLILLNNKNPKSPEDEEMIKKLEEEIANSPLSEEQEKEWGKIKLLPGQFVKIEVYKRMFGGKPPNYTAKEEFNMFIKNRDFVWYSVDKEIKKLDLSKEAATESIKNSVAELYDNIVQLKDAINLQENVYNNQKREYDNLVIRVNQGQAPETEKIIAETELNKLKFQISSIKRTRENLEMTLKKLLGVSLTRNINIEGQHISLESIPSIESLVNNALSERSEIKSAQIDINVKERELDIAKGYLNSEDSELKKAESEVVQKKLILSNVENNIKSEMNKAFLEVQEKESIVGLNKAKLENNKKQLELMEQRYKQGIIPMSTVLSFNLAILSSEMEYQNSMLDLNKSINKLKSASEIGPSYYESISGGK